MSSPSGANQDQGAISAGSGDPRPSAQQRRDAAQLNGLANQVAAVEAARAQLGQDLERLNTQMRAQMGSSFEKTAWTVTATIASVLAASVTRKAMMRGWRATTKHDPPVNPADRQTDWGEALTWAIATGAVIGVVRMVAQRGWAGVWETFTGALPPGVQEVAP